MSSPVLIIAEAGVNHNGDMAIAKELIGRASEAGADFVKFQSFSADKLVTRLAQKAEYQDRNMDVYETQFDMLRRLELTPSMHQELIEICSKAKIGFLSTAFDEQNIDMLAKLGQNMFKIPSGEITNLPYLRHIGRYGKQVILSTGMSNLNEIKAALDVLERAGTSRNKVTVLHCTTEYPAPMQEVNLKAMTMMREILGVQVGYSDHTIGIEVAIAAAALGAVVIEKHFTVDRNLPGPDHRASLEPDELKAMVRSIRHIEQAIGNGIKECSPCEVENRTVARRSIVANQVIKAGDLLTVENITVKRPATGVSPMHWDEVLGTRSKRDYSKDELIEL